MSRAEPGAWRAVIRVRTGDPGAAERLRRALLPEARREVPRARARVRAATATAVEIRVVALETGALRAALNTYLGWADLAAATERAALADSAAPPAAEG